MGAPKKGFLKLPLPYAVKNESQIPAQEPEVDKALVSHPFSEGEGGWWGLVVSLEKENSKVWLVGCAGLHQSPHHLQAGK